MDLLRHSLGAIVARDTIPDFTDPTAKVNGGIWALCLAASVFLGLRLWCKIDRKHGLWWDDYILIASWVSAKSLPTQCACSQPPVSAVC